MPLEARNAKTNDREMKAPKDTTGAPYIDYSSFASSLSALLLPNVAPPHSSSFVLTLSWSKTASVWNRSASAFSC